LLSPNNKEKGTQNKRNGMATIMAEQLS